MATFDVTAIAAINRTDTSEIGAHTREDKSSRPTLQADSGPTCTLLGHTELLTNFISFGSRVQFGF